MFRSILLVCTGNICRSPIAEELLRSALGNTTIRIGSAGTGALVGAPADPMAQLVAREHGYDISAHRARQADQQLLNTSDLILTLDQTHTDWIRSRMPHLLGRTHKLGRWQQNLDVADPYRRPREAFDVAFDEIRAYTEDWLKRIRGA
jgi:protein-tyrosine phosphatase